MLATKKQFSGKNVNDDKELVLLKELNEAEMHSKLSHFRLCVWHPLKGFNKPDFHKEFGLGQGHRVSATAPKRLRDLRQAWHEIEKERERFP